MDGIKRNTYKDPTFDWKASRQYFIQDICLKPKYMTAISVIIVLTYDILRIDKHN